MMIMMTIMIIIIIFSIFSIIILIVINYHHYCILLYIIVNIFGSRSLKKKTLQEFSGKISAYTCRDSCSDTSLANLKTCMIEKQCMDAKHAARTCKILTVGI